MAAMGNRMKMRFIKAIAAPGDCRIVFMF